jgi:hypothetical protein
MGLSYMVLTPKHCLQLNVISSKVSKYIKYAFRTQLGMEYVHWKNVRFTSGEIETARRQP